MPRARDPLGARPLEGRRPFVADAAGRRDDLRRARLGARELPQHPRDHLRRRRHRQRGHPPGLRISRREPGLRRGVPGVLDHVHRPVARGDPPDGRQGAGASDRHAGGRSGDPGQRGGAQGLGRGARGVRSHRLPDHVQGGGRRRWSRDADRQRARRASSGLRRPVSPRPARRSARRRSTARSTSRTRATSRCRCSATATACACISASATARSSGDTRSSSRSLPRRSWPSGRATACARPRSPWPAAVNYVSAGHGRVPGRRTKATSTSSR